MRVLQVSSAKSWRGGENQVWQLMQGLRSYGAESILFAPADTPLLTRALESGITASVLGNTWNPLVWRRISQFIKQNKIDLVHLHDAKAVNLALGLRILSVFGGNVPCIAARRVCFPIRGRCKYRCCQKVICVSEAVKKECLNSGLDASQLTVVLSGIDLDAITNIIETSAAQKSLRAAVRQNWGETPQSPKVFLLTIANLAPEKDHATIIAALKILRNRYPELCCIFAGEGKCRTELKKSAADAGVLEQIRFLGFCKNTPELLNAADLFVMPSISEGLCTSVMDAMAAKLPVIATNCGGLPELVNTATGALFPPGDAAALADTIQDFMNNRNKWPELGENASVIAQNNFSYAKMVDKTWQIYNDVLQKVK